MLNFFHSQKSSFGLDLSDVSLKLFQFQEKKGQKIVQAFGESYLGKEVLSGDQIKDPAALVRIIKKTVEFPKFGKVLGRYVIASIPETKSFVRLIQIPDMSEEEAAEAVPWEAEAYIPMPINQVYLDWAKVEDKKAGAGGKMTVLISASPRDCVDGLVKILNDANLRPLALEVESQATARSLISSAKSQESVLIVDIDAVRTSLIINDKGALEFTSSLPIAGNAFTESVARAFDLNFEEAEKLQQEVGITETPEGEEVKKALLPVLNNLLDEIKNTIRFYEEHSSQDAKISRLLLIGSSSKLGHLPSFLQEELAHAEEKTHSLRSLSGIKVELGDPWVNVLKKGQTPPLSQEDSLSYATAIGLALREFE
jgi:type IV pilus assembly protein PilM